VACGDDDQRRAFDTQAARHLETVRAKQRTYARKAAFCAAELGNPDRVLEMGCGGGFFTAKIARLMARTQLIATDPYPAMIEAARLHTEGLANVEVRELVPADGGFDAVCSIDVIHHLARPEQSLAEWRARVRLGGLLVACEANPGNPVLALLALSKREERRFFLNSRARLAQWAAEAGWADVRVVRLPLYLPSGPERLAGFLDSAETAIHKLLRGFMCGSYLLRARNP
jgi:SAM-dependent methyltransferase